MTDSTPTPTYEDFKRAAERLVELANGLESDAAQATGGGQRLVYTPTTIYRLTADITKQVTIMRGYVHTTDSSDAPVNEARLDQVLQFITEVREDSPRENANVPGSGWGEEKRARHHALHDFIDNVDLLLLGGVPSDSGVGDKELGTQLEYLQAVADDLSSTEAELAWSKEYAASIGIGLLSAHNRIIGAIKRYEQMLGPTPSDNEVGIMGVITQNDFVDAQEIIRNWHTPPRSDNECHNALYRLVHIAHKLIPLPKSIASNPDDDSSADLIEQADNDVDHPNHYGGKDDPFEAIKVIEAWGLGFNLGNTVKYIRRHKYKGGRQDLEKALWYLSREVDQSPSRHV